MCENRPELIKLINLGIEVEKYLGSLDLGDHKELEKSNTDLIELINLGLNTEKYIKETELYLKNLKEIK